MRLSYYTGQLGRVLMNMLQPGNDIFLIPLIWFSVFQEFLDLNCNLPDLDLWPPAVFFEKGKSSLQLIYNKAPGKDAIQ